MLPDLTATGGRHIIQFNAATLFHPSVGSRHFMRLFYDREDLDKAARLNDRRLPWLIELGAVALQDSRSEDAGFLFGYEEGESRLAQQVGDRPHIHDRPDERRELVHLNVVLQRLREFGVDVPTPQTWVWQIDEPPPRDLEFPVFVRTGKSSWKRGGREGRVDNLQELHDEGELLRRAFGWDTPLIVRRWLDIAPAGKWMFGDAPQEVRVWIVDHRPAAWSFHYLHAVTEPEGFPPSGDDLAILQETAAVIAGPFSSRLIAADFVRDTRGKWHFLEAGPGAVAGTAHEAVFKSVANRLIGRDPSCRNDRTGGAF